jgi:hypothetical protein
MSKRMERYFNMVHDKRAQAATPKGTIVTSHRALSGKSDGPISKAGMAKTI